MNCLICIESATDVCSVALVVDGRLTGIREDKQGKSHASSLTVFIRDLLSENNFTTADLNAVAVSKGPGSYTGLRIGVSVAKGLCFALGIPLISVNTMQAMAMEYISQNHPDEHTFLCPMIDARRAEVYTAIFDSKGQEVEPVSAKILNSESFQEFSGQNKFVFFGDGAVKAKSIIALNDNFSFDFQLLPSARGLIELASESYSVRNFEDVAYFEPFYLKDFMGWKHPKG